MKTQPNRHKAIFSAENKAHDHQDHGVLQRDYTDFSTSPPAIVYIYKCGHSKCQVRWKEVYHILNDGTYELQTKESIP